MRVKEKREREDKGRERRRLRGDTTEKTTQGNKRMNRGEETRDERRKKDKQESESAKAVPSGENITRGKKSRLGDAALCLLHCLFAGVVICYLYVLLFLSGSVMGWRGKREYERGKKKNTTKKAILG